MFQNESASRVEFLVDLAKNPAIERPTLKNGMTEVGLIPKIRGKKNQLGNGIKIRFLHKTHSEHPTGLQNATRDCNQIRIFRHGQIVKFPAAPLHRTPSSAY
jgi:hypothetical protein